MVDLSEVKGFIHSEVYEKMLSFVASDLGLAVSPDPVSDTVLAHDVKKINLAGASLKALSDLASDEAYVCCYARAKLNAIAGSEKEQEGKHPEDEDRTLRLLPYYKDFLNIYLLELYFLINQPENLEAYIKAIRIPNAKKYASQLKAVFKSFPRK